MSNVSPGQLVDLIMEHESGNLSDLQTLELFAELIKTGQVWSLQGSYGRDATSLIRSGMVTSEGVITQAAFDMLGEIPETEES